jgi:hypothetical protein
VKSGMVREGLKYPKQHRGLDLEMLLEKKAIQL